MPVPSPAPPCRTGAHNLMLQWKWDNPPGDSRSPLHTPLGPPEQGWWHKQKSGDLAEARDRHTECDTLPRTGVKEQTLNSMPRLLPTKLCFSFLETMLLIKVHFQAHLKTRTNDYRQHVVQKNLYMGGFQAEGSITPCEGLLQEQVSSACLLSHGCCESWSQPSPAMETSSSSLQNVPSLWARHFTHWPGVCAEK